jgi:hypothetical protein
MTAQPLILIALLAAPAWGQSIYKCPSPTPNAPPVIQQMPCSPTGGGETITVKPLPVMGVEPAGVRPGEQEMLQSFQHRIDAEIGTARIGMTEEEARRAWGSPDSINQSSGGDQWVYKRGKFKFQFLYFRNGKMTGFN